jgi:intracellular sulfur oxidation DsrE/DsrF family protein
MKFKTYSLLPMLLLAWSSIALADDSHDAQLCPVGLVSGITLNDEFGPTTQELTRCLEKRHHVKVVVQVNNFCRDAVANPACTRPYALENIKNLLDDYEITYGMVAGKDFDVVAVVHSGGGLLVVKNAGTNGLGAAVTGRNQFEGDVVTLMNRGVKFLFCQNTTRALIKAKVLPTNSVSTAGATGELIPGVTYVTAGVSAIADYQRMGYQYVQP